VVSHHPVVEVELEEAELVEEGAGPGRDTPPVRAGHRPERPRNVGCVGWKVGQEKLC